MTGYPSLGVALLQGLITAAVMLTPWLVIAFGGKLKVTAAEVPLILILFPSFAIVSIAVFWPLEGDWTGMVLGPFEPFRSLVIGGVALTLATWLTQRGSMAGRSREEAVARLGAAFLIGAAWGTVWGFAGWCLFKYGMLGDG